MLKDKISVLFVLVLKLNISGFKHTNVHDILIFN